MDGRRPIALGWWWDPAAAFVVDAFQSKRWLPKANRSRRDLLKLNPAPRSEWGATMKLVLDSPGYHRVVSHGGRRASAGPAAGSRQDLPSHGEGFDYIPGTDTCVWFGGKVRADYGWNVTGVNFPVYFGVGGAQTRQSPAYNTDHRADFDFDARTQTGYGTLRTVGVLRIENAAGANIVTAPRAFIQWAGWTFGHVRSLSDVPAFGEDGVCVIHTIPNEPETRQNGNNEVSNTWEMGNGMALHVGAGERRVKPVSNLSSVVWSAGNNPTTSIAGQTAPNPFVAFKVSEAWGRWDTSITAPRSAPITTRLVQPPARRSLERRCATTRAIPGAGRRKAGSSSTRLGLHRALSSVFSAPMGPAERLCGRQQSRQPEPVRKRQHRCARSAHRCGLSQRCGLSADHRLDCRRLYSPTSGRRNSPPRSSAAIRGFPTTIRS